MRQLRVTVRVLSSLLLALIARTVIDGPTVAGGIGEVAMLLLLLASAWLWRRLRELSPETDRTSPNEATQEAPAGELETIASTSY